MSDIQSDAAVIVDTTLASVEPHTVQPGETVSLVVPANAHYYVADGEYLLPNPRRKREQVRFFETASLVSYVKVHQQETPGGTGIYANRETNSIVAVLNDSVKAAAGWGDHVATLGFRFTQAWKHWTAQNGKQMGQYEFAEHIEQGLNEITNPPAADMLELAQNFDAARKVNFRSVNYLHDGARELVYEETIAAKAGQSGRITIPREFELTMSPYEGIPIAQMVARLRYRIHEGVLTLSYQLIRPEDVLEAAMRGEMNTVQSATGITVWSGTPPRRESDPPDYAFAEQHHEAPQLRRRS